MPPGGSPWPSGTPGSRLACCRSRDGDGSAEVAPFPPVIYPIGSEKLMLDHQHPIAGPATDPNKILVRGDSASINILIRSPSPHGSGFVQSSN